MLSIPYIGIGVAILLSIIALVMSLKNKKGTGKNGTQHQTVSPDLSGIRKRLEDLETNFKKVIRTDKEYSLQTTNVKNDNDNISLFLATQGGDAKAGKGEAAVWEDVSKIRTNNKERVYLTFQVKP